jgi:type I restriction enzyme S subunit
VNKFEPLKRVATVRVSNVDKKSVDGEIPVRLCNYTDVYYGDCITPDLDLMRATASPQQVRSFRLHAGDVVITKDSEDPNDIGISAFVERSASDLVCGYHLAVLRPSNERLHGRYLYWTMKSQPVQDHLSTNAAGITRYGLRTDSIAATPISWHPVDEQRAIAEFLDAETGRIEALIAKKRRLADLVRDRFRSFSMRLTSAEASVSLNVASVAGNGVATDWRVVRLHRCFREAIYGIGEASSTAGDIAVLGMGNVDDEGAVVGDPGGYVDTVDRRLLLRPGDLLFNRTNSLAKVGKLALVRDIHTATTIASYLVLFRVSPIANPAYLNYLLNTPGMLGLARSLALPSIGQANLNPSRFGEMLIVLPPSERQHDIVERLDRERERVGLTVRRLERQIDLLVEHRQALITAAVTGQLDIPGAAA